MHVAIERNSWRLPQDDVVQVVNPKSKLKDDMPDVMIARCELSIIVDTCGSPMRCPVAAYATLADGVRGIRNSRLSRCGESYVNSGKIGRMQKVADLYDESFAAALALAGTATCKAPLVRRVLSPGYRRTACARVTTDEMTDGDTAELSAFFSLAPLANIFDFPFSIFVMLAESRPLVEQTAPTTINASQHRRRITAEIFGRRGPLLML
ncbi:hypothetical protein V9T40_010616 [Parthenolecanium corni]|uniref:Uncharacterized protein n=1 Tax=Parthenolecanium corni TaxID=536013 RepID=A0AAN9T6H6_9HEMI